MVGVAERPTFKRFAEYATVVAPLAFHAQEAMDRKQDDDQQTQGNPKISYQGGNEGVLLGS
jgi:hypothetical protein